MPADLSDVQTLLAVARAGGFREAGRSSGASASTMSEAVRRLEERLGVRLLHRTTRSVTPTEAGQRLIERLGPALAEVEAALRVVDELKGRPAGTLRLNVPVSAARLVLPSILPGFLVAYPDIRVEVDAEDGFVDVLAAGSDAGIRYDERLAQDMIAIPIGPRVQRFATAASPAYLNRRGRPSHPRDLLSHDCILGRFASGALTAPWEFERDGEVLKVEPASRLIVRVGGATDLAVDAAIGGAGVIHLFEDWLVPHFASGALEPVLADWWQPFSGPFLYYSQRRLVPPPLRTFVDYVRALK
ncbi:LysR family transcriptional regulator [Sphingomonas sp. Mn802worker]|uniref:LysR family transcriptional regulator n=1 Tax=Sphingomonas sp. Mn802worker TaxID=629773 RepID=UPI00036D16CD|nr:LysR family transcriptional regulator [Sphingomonas sp. Mn802worker]